MKRIFIAFLLIAVLAVTVSCKNQENNGCEHQFSEWTVVISPSCTSSGVEMRICALCGHGENRFVEKTAHTLVTDQGQAPTCTVEGLTEGKHCKHFFATQMVCFSDLL